MTSVSYLKCSCSLKLKKDGTVWVIETKGGESKGKDKNIDPQIENKFNAFKSYANPV